EGGGVSLKSTQLPAGGDVPEMKSSVPAGEELFAVGGETDQATARGAFELAHLLSRGEVPQPQGAVAAAGDAPLAVSRQLDGADPVGVILELPHLPARAHVPQAQRAIPAEGEDVLAARGEDRVSDRVLGQLVDQLAGLHLIEAKGAAVPARENVAAVR